MKVLKGISVEDFAHPEDAALIQKMDKIKLNQLVEWVSSVNTKYFMEMRLMGRFTRLSETDMPELYALLRDICRVLDYPEIPRVFMYRSKEFDWKIYIAKEPVIVLTDYVFNDFDEGMLRFHLASAVTALKSKTCYLRAVSTFVYENVEKAKEPSDDLLKGIMGMLGSTLLPFLTPWARMATLTEDRGAMLACQDENAAWRYMLRLSGIPRELIDVSVVPDYIAEYKMQSFLSKAGKLQQNLVRIKPWQNDRLLALYDWYNSGAYDDILEDY